MYQNFYLTIIGTILFVGLLLAGAGLMKHRSTRINSTQNASSTESAIVTDQVYRNEEYGFELRHPREITPSPFIPFSILGDLWRVYGKETENGIPVIQLATFSVNQGGDATGKAYPLFYQTLLRVGVSTSTESCYDADEGFVNQPITDVLINTIPFKKVSFQDAATMKYIAGESYRTIYNGTCYVLEQIKVGSNYRDEQMTAGTPEEILNSYYDQAGGILKTFRFTK